MIDVMNVAAVLQRIGYGGPFAPDEATLRGLHRAFVTAVPFENLDIHLGRKIVLDVDGFFEKIALRGRGGFCYELNGLFGAVLRELGFDVTLLSARVFDGEEMGREFVHLVLLVTLDRRWIGDVGFGDWSADPLDLNAGEPQVVDDVSYRIVQAGERYNAQQQEQGGHWRPRYSFTLRPRQLSDFAGMCDDLQMSASSAFRRRRMCTRRTADGRVTLTEEKLIITSRGQRNEIILDGPLSYNRALAEHFGIVLPQ